MLRSGSDEAGAWARDEAAPRQLRRRSGLRRTSAAEGRAPGSWHRPGWISGCALSAPTCTALGEGMPLEEEAGTRRVRLVRGEGRGVSD